MLLCTRLISLQHSKLSGHRDLSPVVFLAGIFHQLVQSSVAGNIVCCQIICYLPLVIIVKSFQFMERTPFDRRGRNFNSGRMGIGVKTEVDGSQLYKRNYLCTGCFKQSTQSVVLKILPTIMSSL